MNKHFATAALVVVLAGAGQAQDTAQTTPGTYRLTADGTWDCSDPDGTYLGAIVLAELSYAFINPDMTVGSYGKLNKDDWLDAPGFFILSGELKEKFGAIGLGLIGPEGQPSEFSNWGRLRMQVVVNAEEIFYCARRQGPTL